MELHYGFRMNVCSSASNIIRALALTGKKGMRSLRDMGARGLLV
jgi:hypothetical protein